MPESRFKSAYILSLLVAVLAVVASLGGLLVADLYRDNALVRKAWFVNDRLTLLVAVPLLAGAMVCALRGSRRAQLLWVSMLAFMAYNYAFYLFGAAFNSFFLVYVALFSLSTFALIFALTALEVDVISRSFSHRAPVRWLSGFMVFIAFFLGFKWVADALGFVFTGRLPQSVVDFAHPTSVVFALDLSLIVPCMVLAALWLWRRRPWGLVLGTVMMVKAANYGLVLMVSSAYVALTGGGWDPLTPFYAVVLLGSLTACGFVFSQIHAEAGKLPTSVLAR